MRFIPFCLAAVAAFSISACQPAADDSAPGTPASEDASHDAAGPAGLALDGEGLRLLNPESGSARPITFGTDQAATLTAVSRVLGSPTETGSNAECPPGPLDFVEFGGDTTLYFQDGAFAGWFTRDVRQSTMNGLAPGWTRVQVEAAGGELSETSLGQEFEAGGVHGVMNEDATTVDSLWAGVNCFFR